jgi:hypothetical protein
MRSSFSNTTMSKRSNCSTIVSYYECLKEQNLLSWYHEHYNQNIGHRDTPTQPPIVIGKRTHDISAVSEGKCFLLQAWCGSWGSRRLRLLDLLDFRHYEGGKVVTLTHQLSLPPGVSWYSFLEAESTPGHMVPSVTSEKIPSDPTGDRFRDPPTSSAVP